MPPVPIYTPGWREAKWSIVPCLRKQRDERDLNPRPPDPWFKVLTAWPHMPSVLLIGWSKFPLQHNQWKALPTKVDLCSDTSSAWNFCACSLYVILQGNQWWHRQMSAVFSDYQKSVYWLVMCKCHARLIYKIQFETQEIIIFVVFPSFVSCRSSIFRES